MSDQLTTMFRRMGEAYQTDIDMSGAIYLEPKESKQVLDVRVTQFGIFYKAFLNGNPITKKELYKILGIKHTGGMRLEYYLFEFEKITDDYQVNYTEVAID